MVLVCVHPDCGSYRQKLGANIEFRALNELANEHAQDCGHFSYLRVLA